MTCKAYLAFAMGGLTPHEIEAKSNAMKDLCWKFGIEPISPWDHQRSNYVLSWDKPIQATNKELMLLSTKDKEAIDRANVLIECEFTQGTAVETGFNRFGLMRPTLHIIPHNYPSLKIKEGDAVVPDLVGALQVIRKRFYTRFQRWLWRLTTVWHPLKVVKRVQREIRSWD